LQNGKGVSIDLEGAAHYFKLAADQGTVVPQFNYALCLRDDKLISIDLAEAAHFLKPAAVQNRSAAQNIFRVLLKTSILLKLEAEQGIVEAQFHYAICFIKGTGVDRNFATAFRYLKLSTENGSSNAQFRVACMAENAIGAFSYIDFDIAIRYYELCSDVSPACSVCFGWCWKSGRGVPVDFTVAVEFFKKASDSNDADGINCFGCCREQGQGVDPDIDWAVWHYQRSAKQFHPDGMYNFGRCLEYGKGIHQNIGHISK
jgi:TPR repeat protein